eukprot:CAMPEP_0117617342 /NCGR_PEP_ID=MMETSP0784-20121206/85544_1 /TAXON_ID=39447 /ORGANISM="" /LENGTH=229 /DNA_ID=CAMNT_0005421183 /DNA_START=185 /DNA_END=870 /DNA_ORIENTATION=+
MKLRKHIRTRRLTAINQLGCDRAVDFTFGRGENAFHLILELYVSGNLILTDHEYTIQALLRTHSDSEMQTKVAVKHVYPIANATGLLTMPIEDFYGEVQRILDKAADRQENQELKEFDLDDERAAKEAKEAAKKGASAYERRSKKRVKHDAMPLVQLLHKLAPFADPTLCAACISKSAVAAGHPCVNGFKLNADQFSLDETVDLLQRAAERVLETLRSVSRPDDFGGGT